MKILYYSTAYYASHGGSIQSIEFYNSLGKLEAVKELSIYPQKSPVINQTEIPTSNLRKFLKRIPLLQIFFFYRKNKMYLEGLKKFIIEFRPDAIVMQIDSNFLQIKSIKSQFPELLVTTQVNASPFDEPFKNIAFKDYFLKKQREAYVCADFNFFISQFLKERIMGQLLNGERDKVVHNGTDIEKFKPLNNKMELRQKFDYPLDPFLIGYIGTLDFHKKMDILIDSMGGFKDKNIKLVIIGDGPAFQTLKSRVQKMNLEEKIIFKGWIDHELMNEHLNSFDLAIHHHAMEYMSPLKIFEYLSSGLPVIAPNIPAVREILKDKEDVILTEPTIVSITKNILYMYENENQRKVLSKNGVEKIRERYTWMNYTKDIVYAIKSNIK